MTYGFVYTDICVTYKLKIVSSKGHVKISSNWIKLFVMYEP